MSHNHWSDIRDEHIAAIGAAEVEAGKNRLLGQIRAHRLAEVRKGRGLTQREVAAAMGVTVRRKGSDAAQASVIASIADRKEVGRLACPHVPAGHS